jgi:hypothetical protein
MGQLLRARFVALACLVVSTSQTQPGAAAAVAGMATPPPAVPLTRRASSSDAFITRHNRPATIEEGAFVPLDDLLRETFLSVRPRRRARDC